ncbi:hypothetical protein ABVK25_006347 [Lepraria finkii]|uniref:Uncharacterized protein n=1 Tax=Lepraria finkii TaxID=1340010 RepID=A0ABR4B657_9LECA
MFNLQARIMGKPMFGEDPSDERKTAGEDAGQSEDPKKCQRSKKRETRGKLVWDPKIRSGMAKLLARLTRNSPKNSEGVDGAKEPDVLTEQIGSERITLEPLARCMFEGVFPRGPVVDYDLCRH